MAHLKTFEDFRKNMVLVDKGISENNGEALKKSIDIAISWLQYAQRSDTEQDRVTYTYSTYIPTLLGTIFCRRHDISREDAVNLLDVLMQVVPMLVGKIGHDETINKCVEQFFNPSHPYYMKLARFDKPPEIPRAPASGDVNGEVIPHDTLFIEGLEVGSYVDAVNASKRWEIAMIDKFSDFRTEFEIVFDSNERQWISLSDYARYAPFGTKTGLVDPVPPSNTSGTSANGNQVTALLPPAIPLTNIPAIGDLVDARNPQGIWYQGCVMDLREEEHTILVEVEPAATVVEAISDVQPKPAATEETMEVCDVNAPDASETAAAPSVAAEVTDDIPEIPTPAEHEAIIIKEAPAMKSVLIKKIFLRIAYIGLFESADEWIDMASERIAVLNSTSNGRRGEYTLREEIFHRAWRGPSFVLDPNHPTEVAYSNEYSFTSPGYVQLVRHFYAMGGIHAMLRALQAVNSEMVVPKVEMAHALPLIRAFSHLSLVLSKSYYQQYQAETMRSIFMALKSITQNDIRSIPVEDIEGALQAFETFFYRVFDRYSEGAIIENFYLEYIWHFLRCPFLNRRLGGLKALQDLLKRASVKSLYPDGIQKVEYSKDKISYKMQKITYSLTIHSICAYMMSQNILDALYLGSDTHDSLIERSGSILRMLSLTDVLETNHFLALMRVGLEKNKQLLKVLPEMASTLRDEKIMELLDYIGTIDHVQVNQDVVNIVSAIVERYRTKIMYTNHPSRAVPSWQGIHEQAGKLLWSWMNDEAETSDAVAVAATQKLESLMEIGLSHQKALEDATFRWDMQWLRTKPLIELILEFLKLNKSVVPCLKILGAFLFSWPMQYPHSLPLRDNAAPFQPRRLFVATYLVESANLFGLLGNCIISAKASFVKQCANETKNVSANNSTTADGYVLLTASTVLSKTRATYGQHLEQLLDVVHMLFRSLEKKRFPVDTVELIWEELISRANIAEEFEAAMNFIAKIPTKIVDSASSSSSSSSASASAVSRESSAEANTVSTETAAAVSSTAGSFFHVNKELYMQFFCHRLCDEDQTGFFGKEFFTLKNFRCIEKWFRWINAELDQIHCSKEGKVLHVHVDPAELVGVNAFVRVCFETLLESIANASVTLITSLTRAAKQSKKFREELVSRTMSTLEDANRKSSVNHQLVRSLKRPLMLLDGLIDESYLLSTQRLYPHSSLFHGNKAIFKISGTSKNTKSFSGDISLRLGETVEDLFNAVAKEMKLTAHDIKIFRQGKEILPSEFRKTISQLPMSAGERSALVIAERPHKAATSASAAAAATNSSTVAGPAATADSAVNHNNNNSNNNSNDAATGSGDTDSFVTVVPAAIASGTGSDSERPVPVALSIATNMKTFECFFDLISKSQGEQIDHLWKTVGQLPTSWHTVAGWASLDCANVQELAFPLDDAHFHRVGELIYILQVIEIVLYPVVSMKDLILQYGIGNESLLTETATSWCEKFVAKQGLQFLCNSYEWITTIMCRFNARNSSNNDRSSATDEQSFSGVNLSLLLLGARTTTKLLKGFQARSLAEDRSNAPAHKFLEDFLYRFHGKKVINLFTPSFSDDLNLTLRLQQIREKITAADGGTGMNTKSNDHMVLSVDPQIIISTERLYWSSLLRFTAFMELERSGKFLAPPLTTSTTSSWLEVGKSLEGQEKRLLASSMQDLLFLWTAISLSKPDFLQQKSSPDGGLTYEIVFRAVAGSHHATSSSASSDATSATSSSTPSSSYASAVTGAGETSDLLQVSVVDWFPVAFMEFIQWVISKAQSHVLIVQSIHTLIHIRPPIALFTPVNNQDLEIEKCDHYFALLSKLLQLSTEQHLDIGNLHGITNSILLEFRNVSSLARASGNAKMIEFSNLAGNLSLFNKICTLDPTTLSSYSMQQTLDTVDFLVKEILGFGSITDINSQGNKFHLTSETKKLVYGIVQAFCEQKPSLAVHVYQSFKHIHRALEPPREWEILPERNAKSRFGFVGLKNFGATCYMNSLLQVMFTNLPVRKYLLEELNLDGVYSDDELRNNLWYQLQKIVLHLQYSEKKSYSPSDWVFAFKDETGVQPLNTMMQQDAQEFLQLLFERCESMMNEHCKKLKEKPTQVTAGESIAGNESEAQKENLPHDILNEAFAGSFCNIMYVSPSSVAGGVSSMDAIQHSIRQHGIRTQQESFVSISVDLVGPNLESSLETFVKGETIPDFSWKENTPRCEIVKKQCLSHLSDSVIFHLKRFKYNFDTYRREKINDAFAFPLTLNMKPYTREGQPEFQPYHAHSVHHPHRSGENSPSAEDDASNAPASPLSPSDILEIASRAPEYYEYELAGVVVHTGTADSGHYYAFLKDYTSSSTLSESGQWYEFNDAEISVFNLSQLEQNCYGGMKKVSDYIHATQSIVETMEANPKNAYMLIYNRIQPLKMSKVSGAAAHFASPSTLLQSIHRSILADNVQHRLACRILAKDHLQFYGSILRTLVRQAAGSTSDMAAADQEEREKVGSTDITPPLRAIWNEALQFLLRYALHTPHSIECLGLSTQMTQWFMQDLQRLQQDTAVTTTAAATAVAVAVAVEIDGDDSNIHQKENVQPLLPSLPTATVVVGGNSTGGADFSLLPPAPPSLAEEKQLLHPHDDISISVLPPPAPSASHNNTPDEYVIVPLSDATDPAIATLSTATTTGDSEGSKDDNHKDASTTQNTTAPPVLQEISPQALADQFSAPLLTMTPVSAGGAISAHLLTYLCEEGDLLSQVFFAPNIQYREAMQQLFYQLFAHAWHHEHLAVHEWIQYQNEAHGDACIWPSLGIFDRMVMAMTMPDPTSNHGANNMDNAIMDFDQDLANEDPELLLALKLSQETAQAPTASANTATNNVATVAAEDSHNSLAKQLITQTNNVDFPFVVVRFVVEMTQDHRLQMIPDEWRKSYQYVAFIASLLRIGGRDIAQILVRRDMIGQLLDIFLGEVSPLKGRVYFANAGSSNNSNANQIARKRAPSSYITSYITKDFPKIIPLNLRSIPDWSELLDAVVMLVSQCLLSNEARDYYQNKRRRTAVPMSSPNHNLLMSEYDYECLTCKTLYTTLMKQARYRSYVCSLVKLLAPNNYIFSNMILEILWEECSIATPEACLVLFEVAESLLSIQDMNSRQRVYSLLGRGQQSIVELVGAMVNHHNKANFILTFIRSYLTLLQRLPDLCSIVANPIENVHHWAKWMLIHCHQLRQTANNTSTNNSGAPVTMGPFMVVYGESEEERELAWHVRAERTYELLALRLFEWGLEPDLWILDADLNQQNHHNNNNNSSNMNHNNNSNYIHMSTGMDDDDSPPPLLLTNGQLVTDTCTVIKPTVNNKNSLSQHQKHSVQNTSTNSLGSTGAIDGDLGDRVDDLVNDDEIMFTGPQLNGGIVDDKVSKSVSISTQVEEIGVGNDDMMMFMDGMTDEELERMLAKGGMFQ